MKRKLPRHITIGGVKFAIRFQALMDGQFGQMEIDSNEIILNFYIKHDPQLVKETLRHEMVHAALAVAGISFGKKFDEESIVRCLDYIFFPAWDRIAPKLP
jgi:hypothetical protein